MAVSIASTFKKHLSCKIHQLILQMHNYKFLTVVYHETPAHFNMAKKAWGSIDNTKTVAVINKALKYHNYPQGIKYIQNRENNLSMAWNRGLKSIFTTCDYAVVMGLDSIAPEPEQVQELIEALENNPNLGLVSATGVAGYVFRLTQPSWTPVKHGDGSFSFFVISKEAFQKVGEFDTNFSPAYFEDNDYLERLWEAGYTPMRAEHISYYHVFQGTIKRGDGISKKYADFMNKNLNYFRQKWGKTPDHLPPDIRFT